MIGSAPKPTTRRDEETRTGATILPFRLRANPSVGSAETTAAPLVEIDSRKNSGATQTSGHSLAVLSAAERPTIVPPHYRGWLQQAVFAAAILHLALFAVMHFQFINDVERAANSGGNQSDGTTVLDVEIVAEAKLPPSKTPTNMTSPDATKQTNTPPQEKQQEEKQEIKKEEIAPNNAPQFALPEEELAAPNKAETSEAPQSPDQKKEDVPEQKNAEQPKAQPKKKKQEQTAPSTAASPNRAAGNRSNQPQAGANGNRQVGGNANSSSYNAMVIAHLQRYRTYPEQARAAGIRGVSTVNFRLARTGAVVAVSLVKSSGSSTLDQAALAMVRRASPFPAFPGDYQGSGSFTAPLNFNLR